MSKLAIIYFLLLLNIFPAKAADEVTSGKVLVAARNTGGVFSETVVLIVEHSRKGTLGLILNRPSTVTLQQLLPEIKHLNLTVHTLSYGGPVGLERLHFLFRNQVDAANVTEVMEGLFASADPVLLEKLLAETSVDPNLRVYAGYAGWAPGQLDQEMQRQAWHLYQLPIDSIWREHSLKEESLWQELINNLEPLGVPA